MPTRTDERPTDEALATRSGVCYKMEKFRSDEYIGLIVHQTYPPHCPNDVVYMEAS